MSRKLMIIIAVAAIVAGGAIWFLFLRGPATPPVYSVAIVAKHPHDPRAFTQGLFFHQGSLYEGTGQVGQSGIRKTDPATGAVQTEQPLAPPNFGEGITLWKDKIYQVTWQNQAGFIYNLSDFALVDSFSYPGEGWGLTQDGKQLILSDGSPTIRFLNPDTRAVVRTIQVTAGGCPVEELNELEWVDGKIYANIWQTDLIARIDPATGIVESFLEVGPLGPETADPDAVANGIAWDAQGKRLFVTGKLWPETYEVRQGDSIPATEEAKKITSCKR
ncbi:glutaminyl-peptide cyclotransferase [Sphingomonas canadensis]|uniref:Glutaminyl-peptide cyclotransferase n=1 Tax=Sphingomonas canadensis TaxID=1219257 RepID=A0ABW3H8M3_9SPHN|nr:glutaminyl-peptide cyclotransferase [Sphingomonas canadensis]MCW3837350.1 glutaminyl-peptide cyclotransferase [Sphingomonas canadensis]